MQVAGYLSNHLNVLSCVVHSSYIPETELELGFGFITVVASTWLSLPLVILAIGNGVSERPLVESACIAVSVTVVVFQGRVVTPTPNPRPGGPGDYSLSDLYPLTCLAWLNLLEAL